MVLDNPFDTVVLMRIEEDLMMANIMKQAEMNYQAGLLDQQAYRILVRKINDDFENRIKKRSEMSDFMDETGRLPGSKISEFV